MTFLRVLSADLERIQVQGRDGRWMLRAWEPAVQRSAASPFNAGKRALDRFYFSWGGHTTPSECSYSLGKTDRKGAPVTDSVFTIMGGSG